MSDEKRAVVMSVKVPPRMVADLTTVAAQDGRSISDFLYRLIRAHLYGRLPTMVPPPVTGRFFRGAEFTKQERVAVFKRSEGVCAYCKSTLDPFAFAVDHVVPVAKGGTRDPANLVAACKPCNSAKGARDASEFRATLVP